MQDGGKGGASAGKMEATTAGVGRLEEEALRRKERLKALREKTGRKDKEDGEPKTKHLREEEEEGEKHRELRLRNYVPEDEDLKKRRVPQAKPVAGKQAAPLHLCFLALSATLHLCRLCSLRITSSTRTGVGPSGRTLCYHLMAGAHSRPSVAAEAVGALKRPLVPSQSCSHPETEASPGSEWGLKKAISSQKTPGLRSGCGHGALGQQGR
ncbi:PREDICTED: coiled-coil domain-containing protein 12 isoform X1 [Colobus angolensis palliatus]|uniref:coiled-coil domain-containing protein 12 isoform X1 n=1 Tax=Colobus angolensis palliatus TaxID=336983 RepID=UPI0005F4E0FD|nr:PREDICTED: coiled-coil domain-containing protein 12 isoform X1 [Colobus angolensis palliatus]